MQVFPAVLALLWINVSRRIKKKSMLQISRGLVLRILTSNIIHAFFGRNNTCLCWMAREWRGEEGGLMVRKGEKGALGRWRTANFRVQPIHRQSVFQANDIPINLPGDPGSNWYAKTCSRRRLWTNTRLINLYLRVDAKREPSDTSQRPQHGCIVIFCDQNWRGVRW